jgi:hypothetical protein
MLDPTADVIPARLEAHLAAQLPGRVGTTWLPHDPGFQYGNLGWDPTRKALLSRPVQGLQGGLHLPSLTWCALRDGERFASKAAIGSTLDEGAAWFRDTLVAAGLPDRELQAEAWDLPEHPVVAGAPFAGAGDRDALTAWFDIAHALLTPVAAGGSELRCWPHHFDLATLLTLQAHEDPHRARTVGVGMTPGDGGIPLPYLYVTPWPYPAEPWPSPPLPAGRWNRQGWFGAVYSTDDLPLEGQAEAMGAFVAAAVAACRELLAD